MGLTLVEAPGVTRRSCSPRETTRFPLSSNSINVKVPRASQAVISTSPLESFDTFSEGDWLRDQIVRLR